MREERRGSRSTSGGADAGLLGRASWPGSRPAQQGVDPHLARSMLDLYDVGGDRWTETLRLVRGGAASGRGGRSTGWAATSATCSSRPTPSQVQDYVPGYVPGLLQTRDYARIMFTSDVVELDRRAARGAAGGADDPPAPALRRRANPLRLVAVVGEAALRNPIGGPDVMRAQLAHMAEAAGLPTVTLQVLPARCRPARLAGLRVLRAQLRRARRARSWPTSSTRSVRRTLEGDRRGVAGPEEVRPAAYPGSEHRRTSLALLREIAAAT